nr:gliding motility lipoprotein GldB [Allomuricauda sp.]
MSKYLAIKVLGVVLIVTLLGLQGCRKDEQREEKIAQIPVELNISRFDREFAQAEATDIPALKSKYPYLFPAQYPDNIWEAKLTDTIQNELEEEIHKAFGDFERESNDLKALFQHAKFYFPQTNVPHIVTITSDVGYNDRVILTDSLLILGLDNYLGQDHHFYEGIQRYIAAGLDRNYLTSDVASALSKQHIKFPRKRTFLSRMIYYGKELHIKDSLLPNISDGQKIGYSQAEMDWAMANEEQIWRYFVERELLYSTDAKLDRRFLDPAPFSKFQLELDSESPGRLGRYLGWQIVRAFMANNQLTLSQMIALPSDEIFKKSNYKPRK